MYRVVGPIGCTGGKYPCSYNGKNGTTAIINCDHPTIFIGLFCATINHVRNKMIIALITEAKRMRWDSSKESQNLAFAKLA
ncbi:hypothetical protein MCOR29_008837 [Pyricularia oryzae]|uniref:Uncharacterized protein n=1 Tax=Pyricularia grisea TaxID=148305 RepID=A0ABQ8N6I5_PYRGI|nr:hypothetical protein MCOR33_010104 [Pyricularia grisea]KAI6306281.1 hypothetical protein MCOR34_008101 [Pyricularia oryzae]KAI6309774.1 hypothetical protein MCOR29_008837 [Pyricularia oryzae]KAI6388461.1 hypothetical protein MCOR23_010706 [Pyricularia oryzae]KAI6480654.1 hypothetical protein MCOR18_005079 [Pyricularia oryzae]